MDCIPRYNDAMNLTSRPSRRAFVLKSGAAVALAPLVLTGSKVTYAADPAPDADGYISLFDGKSLAGWHKNPKPIGHGTGGLWEVMDGAIVGEQDPPGSGNGGILLTDRKFGDFELELDMKPDWGPDSGLFVRANDAGQCIQMMVDYHEDGSVGHVYGEGTGGWSARPFDLNGKYDANKKLVALTTQPSANFDPKYLARTCTGEEFVKAWKINDWNRCKVRCTGKYPRVVTWINDLLVCDFDGETFKHPQYDREKVAEQLGREGSIAVQVHGGKGAWPAGAKCRWRNIRVKTL